MGTGKTTLVKEGISKILGREFSFIALGGNSDASFLEDILIHMREVVGVKSFRSYWNPNV